MVETLPADAENSLGSKLLLALAQLEKPVIAAVNGPAAGLGFELSLVCDFRIASDRANFSEAFVRVGALPRAGMYLLPRMAGWGRAAELLYTGRKVDAEEAASIGLVNKVVPHGSLMEAAFGLADELAAAAPLAVAMSKRLLWGSANMAGRFSDMMTEVGYVNSMLLTSADHKEAVQAFLEKRTPRFEGR